MIKASVKEIERPGRNVLQVVSRKGKPIMDFPINRGARKEVIAFFKDNDLAAANSAPDWLKRGLEKGEEYAKA